MVNVSLRLALSGLIWLAIPTIAFSSSARSGLTQSVFNGKVQCTGISCVLLEEPGTTNEIRLRLLSQNGKKAWGILLYNGLWVRVFGAVDSVSAGSPRTLRVSGILPQTPPVIGMKR